MTKKASTKPPVEPLYSRAELKRLLEAILFAADKPVAPATLGQILSGSPEVEVREALTEMAREYEEMGRSFVLKEVGGGYLLFTHPAYEPWVRKLFRGRLTLRLSKSSMETLAVIAYRQPVTKQDIETIRGVNADGVLNTLLDRKLVRVTGRKEGMGRALLYGTTNEFLIYMGLNDLNELPQMEEMKAILETRETPPSETGPTGPFAMAGTGQPTESAEPVATTPVAPPSSGAEPATETVSPEPQEPAVSSAPESPNLDGTDKTGDEDEDEDEDDDDEEEKSSE